jgi:hypothetical protein
MKYLIPALVLLLLGTVALAVLYAVNEPPADGQPAGVELEIDRAEPRPPLKPRQPKKGAPRKVK